MLHYAIPYHTELFYAKIARCYDILYNCAILYVTMLHDAAICYTVLYYHYTILYHTILYYTILYCTVPHYSALQVVILRYAL